MADEGYYRSDGIQNSGTALTSNGNVYIFTGTSFMQIYPREVSATLDNSSFGGGWDLITYRKKKDGSSYGSRTPAFQGLKSIGKTKSNWYISCGHITPNNIPRYNNLISVDYVRISFKPHHCGIHSIDRVLSFNVKKNNENFPPLTARAEIDLYAQTDTKSRLYANSDDYPALKNMIYHLLTEGTGLCLHNDETSIAGDYIYQDSTGYGSRNYVAIEKFYIEEVRLKYRP